jgi:hypothetical protein
MLRWQKYGSSNHPFPCSFSHDTPATWRSREFWRDPVIDPNPPFAIREITAIFGAILGRFGFLRKTAPLRHVKGRVFENAAPPPRAAINASAAQRMIR